MLQTRKIASLILAVIAVCSCHARTGFLDNREITLRWVRGIGVEALTTFTVDSRAGAVEVAEFPPGGGPVSVDVQDQDEDRATVVIRWLSNAATGIENSLEFTNLPPYSALYLEEVEWAGVDERELRRFPDSFTFHVGAYPGLNSSNFFVRIELLRVQLRIQGPPTPEGLLLRANGKEGHDYRLQKTGNLSSGNWSNVVSFTMPVTGVTNIVDSSATNFSTRFYRLAEP